MLVNLFSIEKKPSLDRPNRPYTPPAQEDKLKKQNERLKKEVETLYHMLVDKEALIFKLKKFICEELKKPDYDDKYYLLEDQLNDILKDEEDYDPRVQWRQKSIVVNSPFYREDVRSREKGNIELDKNNVQDLMNHIGDEAEEKKLSQEKEEFVLKVETRKIFPEQEQSSPSEENSPELRESERRSRPRYSLIKKNHDIKKVHIKPVEIEIITRHLFSFELELKEYSPSTFEAIKQFVSKSSFTAEEIHDEIERLAEMASKQKYFQKIFPEDTSDKLADELENYILEILHPKLFIIDEDIKGFSQQFKDRLNVLKTFVNFDMLEFPEEMRRESLYFSAIREFEKVNQFKAPIWKLQAFQNCVNHVLNIFNETVQRSPNSDELFPVLVYVVLQANIDLLKYNLYIYLLEKMSSLWSIGILDNKLKSCYSVFTRSERKFLASRKVGNEKNRCLKRNSRRLHIIILSINEDYLTCGHHQKVTFHNIIIFSCLPISIYIYINNIWYFPSEFHV